MFTITWFDLHKTFHKLCTKYSFEISYFIIPSRLFKVLWYTFLPTSFTALFLLSICQSHPHGINCKSIRQLPAKSSGPSHDFNILKRRQRGFFQCFYFCHIAGFYAFGHKRADPSLFRGLQCSPSNKEGTLNVSTCNYHQIKF